MNIYLPEEQLEWVNRNGKSEIIQKLVRGKMETERKSWIERLNSLAVEHEQGGMSALDAVEQAAVDLELDEVETDGQCRIYRTPDGLLVNCWIEGPMSEHVEDGGYGYDDQIEWYTDR